MNYYELIFNKIKIHHASKKRCNKIFFFSRPHGDHVSVTPILGILVAIGCGLALVAVAIILVLKFRPSHSGYPSSGQGAGTTHRRHKGGLISEVFFFKFGPILKNKIFEITGTQPRLKTEL